MQSNPEKQFLKPWEDFTERQETSLGGLSLKDLPTLWDQNEFELAQPVITFETTVAFPNEEEASLSGIYKGANAIKRYLGCIILMHLPENGVDEAFEWLVDAWQFYTHPVSAASLPALAGPTVNATGKATILRPALDIEE
jgi:hypothetical protein